MLQKHLSSIRSSRASVFLIAAGLAGSVFACSSGQNSPVEREAQRALRGELKRVVVGDPDRGVSTFQYFVELADDRWIELVVDSVPEHAINQPVVLTGHAIDADHFRVNTLEVIEQPTDGIGRIEQPLITVTPKKVAVILANYRNDTSQPITVARARELVFTGPDSSEAYFTEVSFGARTMQGLTSPDGDVYDWVTLDHDNTPCNYSTWGSNARAKVAAKGFDLSGYHHIVHFFPRTSACNFSGVGQLPGKYNWINGSSNSASTISHELGHNFGVHHASSYVCTEGGVRVSIGSSCTRDEYGDPFDVMGRGGQRHMSLYQKGRLGWLEPENTRTVTAAGDYTISTMETKSTGVQSLRVGIPGTNEFYYIEARQSVGFDNWSSTTKVVNAITIRRATDYGTLIRPALIDTVPSTTSFTDAPLAVNSTFTDAAAAISITHVSRSSTSAVVRIGFGGMGGGGGGGSDAGAGGDGGVTPTCMADETSYKGHCYVRLTTARSFEQSRTACIARGSALAVVGDAAENTFIAGLIGSAESWLGGNDITTEGTWVWSTGQTFYTGGAPVSGVYTNFVTGEPNDVGGSDCLRMLEGGGWRDIGCTASYQAVCEKG